MTATSSISRRSTDQEPLPGPRWIESRTSRPSSCRPFRRTSSRGDLDEEKDFFAPVQGPDGTTYWLVTRVEGQQILSVAGQNVVLLREIDFKNLRINDPLRHARQAAYDSAPDAARYPRGLKYLARTDTGERVVRERETRSALLGLAGSSISPG